MTKIKDALTTIALCFGSCLFFATAYALVLGRSVDLDPNHQQELHYAYQQGYSAASKACKVMK